MTITEVPVAIPAVPFRGIHPFRYIDHPIFFAREEETHRLVSLISVYRGVMLYGDSGSGKSSLINAGLIPSATELGFTPERLRVQPRPGQELVLERVPLSETTEDWLPSALACEGPMAARRVFSLDEFAERLESAAEEHRMLLIFDQFEELITLFDESDAGEQRERLVAFLGKLLHGAIPVKLLFSFREDYLGRVKELLSAAPELVDQALRLASPTEAALRAIISGPFERYPERYYSQEFPPTLVDALVVALSDRFQSGAVSLSEVQIVCLRLWQSDDAKRRFATSGIGGLLEDYLGDELSQLPARLRPAAVALLSQMVTSAGTRNVVSAEDLAHRLDEEGEHFSREELDETLARLSEARLVRSERRRDLYLYELASEFLVPWISRRRDELNEERKRRRDVRRLRALWGVIAALLAIVVGMGALAVWALDQKSQARREAAVASSLGLASDSKDYLDTRLDVSLITALAALAPYHAQATAPVQAREAMLRGLTMAHDAALVGILRSPSDITDLEVSPDGRTLATSSNDGTVRLWNAVTHREIGGPLRGHTDTVWAVAFSPDGRMLASAGDTTVRLWDPRTGRPLGVLHDPDLAFSVAISPDGKYIAAADGSGVQIWDAHTRRKIERFGPSGGLYSIAFSPRGDAIAGIPLQNSGLLRWAFPSGRSSGTWPGPATVFAYRPQGDAISVVSRSRIVELWSPSGGARSNVQISAGAAKINTVAYSADGKLVIGGCSDGSVRFWSATTGQLVSVEQGPASGIAHLAVGRDGRTIASSSGRTIELSSAAAAATGAVDVSVTTPSSTSLPGGMTGQGLEFLARNHLTTRPFSVPAQGSSSSTSSPTAAVSPDGHILAFNNGGPNTDLWDLSTGRSLRPIRVAPDQFVISDYAFSPVGTILAITYVDGPTEIWDYRSHTLLQTLPTSSKYIDALMFSPNGRLVATADETGTVKIWNPRGGRHPIATRALGDHTGIYTLQFTPGGQTIAFISGDSIGFWKFRANRILDSVGVPGNVFVSSLAFSPDGRTLAAGTSDGAIKLWDAGSRKELDEFSIGHKSSIGSVAFWPDSNTVIAGADDGTIHTWSNLFWRSYAQLKADVCGLVGGGLDPAEWRQYAPEFTYTNPCH
jgi:WD40 repeat protein